MTGRTNSTTRTFPLRTLALLGVLILLAQPVAAATGCLLQGMDLTECVHCDEAAATGHSHPIPPPESQSDCCDVTSDDPATRSSQTKPIAKKEVMVLASASLAQATTCEAGSAPIVPAQPVRATERTQAQLCSFRN